MSVSRRNVLKCALGATIAPFFNRNRYALASSPANSFTEYSAQTIEVIQQSMVIDMLGLLTLDYPKLIQWQERDQAFPLAEFHRVRESGVNVIHPGVGFVKGDVYASSLRDLSGWNQLIAAHPSEFLRVDTITDLDRSKVEKKIGVILGLQNSQHFRTLADVDTFYALGQRISQLTYYDNALGGGSTDPSKGLSDYGAQILARMNHLGMAVDLSHCSDRTTLDAIEASTKPVLVTHSNCRSLVPGSARCKPDAAIRRLASNGGVLGVTMVRYFVRPSGPATMEDLLDHVDHVVAVAGIEHVGLGSDLDLDGRDGQSARKQDLDGLKCGEKIFDFTAGLLHRGYSTSDVALILGENFRRALHSIWS